MMMMGLNIFADPASIPSQEVEASMQDVSSSERSGSDRVGDSSGRDHSRRMPRQKSRDKSPRRHRKTASTPMPETSMQDHLEDIEAFCKTLKAAGSEKASELISDQIRAKRENNAAKKNKSKA